MSKCQHCGIDFSTGNTSRAKRGDSKFCSNKCRYAASNERKKLYRQANAALEYMLSMRFINRDTQNAQNVQLSEHLLEALTTYSIHGDVQKFDVELDTLKSKYGK